MEEFKPSRNKQMNNIPICLSIISIFSPKNSSNNLRKRVKTLGLLIRLWSMWITKRIMSKNNSRQMLIQSRANQLSKLSQIKPKKKNKKNLNKSKQFQYSNKPMRLCPKCNQWVSKNLINQTLYQILIHLHTSPRTLSVQILSAHQISLIWKKSPPQNNQRSFLPF